MKFDHIIMNPPYTVKVERGRKRALDLDFPIYKMACSHSDDVVCLMRRSQKYKKNGNYTGYYEDGITFAGVGVEVGIFEYKADKPTIKIKSKYEENGKLQWIRDNDLTGKTKNTLWHLIDRNYNNFKEDRNYNNFKEDRNYNNFKEDIVVPHGYVALSEVSSKNFTVFVDGEIPLKRNGEPLRMLVFIKTSNPIEMKNWLLNYVNPLHNEFRKFGDNHIDRGFTRTVLVPGNLLP